MNVKRRMTAVAAVAALLFAALGTVPTAVADTSPPPDKPPTVSADPLPTWQINGVVWAQVVVNNIVYVTGSFTKARPPGVKAGGAGEVTAQNILAYDIRTGNRVAAFNHALNAQGRAITATPDGSKVFVGRRLHHRRRPGPRSRSRHSSPRRTPWIRSSSPTSTTPSARSRRAAPRCTSAVSTRRSTRPTRYSVSAVTIATGALTSWAPRVDDYAIWSMVLAPGGSRLIVGGSFTKLNGVAAWGMGSLDVADGRDHALGR